jgi:hypothetical protein
MHRYFTLYSNFYDQTSNIETVRPTLLLYRLSYLLSAISSTVACSLFSDIYALEYVASTVDEYRELEV